MSDNILGIDLGGTNTKIGLGTLDGELIKTESIPTLVQIGPEAWVNRVSEVVNKWGADFSMAGVGSPGPIDTTTGTILHTPNLGAFVGFSMKSAFETKFKRPFIFENDANCAALSEFYFGQHQRARELVVLTLGTGVGSGVISSGRLVRGHKGFATEIGHMIIQFEGRKCHCGKTGCFEAYVGGRATLERFKSELGESLPHLSMKELFNRAKMGEPVAISNVEIWTKGLAIGLANVITIFNPEVIVISGGVSESWPQIKTRLFSLLGTMIDADTLESTKVELSILGEFFGVQGAIALALEKKNGSG